MNCSKCGHILRVTNTYKAGNQARTHRAICDSCFTVHIIQSIVVQIDPDRGEGARALAKKLASPKVPR